jgi:hypothetical protein
MVIPCLERPTMAVGESVLRGFGGFAFEDCERIAPALCSALLHGLLLIALVLGPAIGEKPPPAEETAVDILSPEQFDQTMRRAKAPDRPAEKPTEKSPARAPAETGDLPASAAPTSHPAPGEEGPIWRKAAQILSEARLADPRHRKLAARLRLLETNTRLEQICNLEALLQISQREKQFHPETVIAYAMRETRSDGDSIVADGAAFHSDGQWYNLAFKCRISVRQQKVSAFEFATGAAIPERDWASHDLPRGAMQAADD